MPLHRTPVRRSRSRGCGPRRRGCRWRPGAHRMESGRQQLRGRSAGAGASRVRPSRRAPQRARRPSVPPISAQGPKPASASAIDARPLTSERVISGATLSAEGEPLAQHRAVHVGERLDREDEAHRARHVDRAVGSPNRCSESGASDPDDRGAGQRGREPEPEARARVSLIVARGRSSPVRARASARSEQRDQRQCVGRDAEVIAVEQACEDDCRREDQRLAARVRSANRQPAPRSTAVARPARSRAAGSSARGAFMINILRAGE